MAESQQTFHRYKFSSMTEATGVMNMYLAIFTQPIGALYTVLSGLVSMCSSILLITMLALHVFKYSLLRRIGGETVAETVKEIMRRLFTNYVMSFFNMDGRSYGKIAFRQSRVCRAVVGESNSAAEQALALLNCKIYIGFYSY
jgi:hypothetical protein